MKWLAALGIGLGFAVCCIDFSIVNTSIYPIKESLNTSLLEMIWVMNAFGIATGVLLVTVGRIADIFGRKKIFCIGLLLFALGALIAGFAHSINWLLFARVIQGIANAILLTMSVTLIIQAFPKEEHHLAVGIWSAISGLSLAVGPILGGILLSYLSWRWIFFIDIPFIILSLIIISFSVKESRNDLEGKSIDWKGFIYLTIGLFFLVYSILEGSDKGWFLPKTLSGFAISIISFILLYFSEKKTKFPMIKFKLFNNRDFLICAVSNSALLYSVWSAFFVIPLFLHKNFQFSNSEVGVTLLFLTLSLVTTSLLAGVLSREKHSKKMILSGSVLLLISTVIQAFMTESSIILMNIALVLFGSGWGIMWAAIMTRGIASLPKNMAGVASGGWMTMQEVFACLGLSITGSILHSNPNFLAAYHLSFWLMAGLFFISTVCILFFLESQGKRPEVDEGHQLF